MAQEFKKYVNINNGVLCSRPVEVNGEPFPAPSFLYEITEDQATRLNSGEALADVIREGVEAKIQAEVEGLMHTPEPAPEEVKPTTKPKAKAKKAPAVAESTDIADTLAGLKTSAKLDDFAKAQGVDIPSEYATVEDKKEFLATVLLD